MQKHSAEAFRNKALTTRLGIRTVTPMKVYVAGWDYAAPIAAVDVTQALRPIILAGVSILLSSLAAALATSKL
jgi:hypothetical protein